MSHPLDSKAVSSLHKNLSVNYIDTQRHFTERDDRRSEVVERKEAALELLVAHE